MTIESCSVELHGDRAATVVRVAVTGEVDASNCGEVQAALDGLAHDEVAHAAELDLGGLRFIDSSGLRVLLVAQLALQQRGGSMRIVEASPAVERLLEITGLHAQFR